jgi:hopanoid biosynthesis associated protein HpnK
MKRLIINADDFGFTRGVNAGIVRAFNEGLLTSTTIMANGDAFEDAAELARANPGLAVGCHLAAIGGGPVAPASEVASLVGEDGRLPQTLSQLMASLVRGKVRMNDVEREFQAQVERVIASGITPTHLDTHKHSHADPRVFEALARVARRFHIERVRNPFEAVFDPYAVGVAQKSRRRVYFKQWAMSAVVSARARKFRQIARSYGLVAPDHFRGVRLTGLLDSEAVRSVISSLKEGTTELMCHPGIYDEELEQAHTRLKRERQRELEALTDPALRRAIEERGVQLISYRELV